VSWSSYVDVGRRISGVKVDAREEILGATWLASRYQVAGLRARGALCLVYQGQDAVLQRPVAIKAPLAQQREAYRSALALTSALAHPAFLALYDVIEQGDGLFLAYEFVDGRPLTDYVSTGLPLRRALALMLQVTRALVYAHTHGVAHGDLTPAAILVDRAAIARVSNLGMPPDGAYFDDVAASAYTSGVADDPDTTAALLTENAEYLDTWADAAILWQLIADAATADSAGGQARTFRADTPDQVRSVIERAMRTSHPQAITTAESLEAELAELDGSLADSAMGEAEPTPPRIIVLRSARERAEPGAPGVRDAVGAMRWRTVGTVSPTATTSYGAQGVSAPIEAEDASDTLPSDDMAYEAHAPRLRLPAKPLAEANPPLRGSPRTAELDTRRGGAAPSKAREAQDGLGGWVWTLIGVAVFTLCFLAGFFVTPVIPLPHLP
jgi:eukaryotic-like serine/threonine-protein kinase